jgi:4-amino-4-deoxy-L-arabinose transferase-like glycosyltransferase
VSGRARSAAQDRGEGFSRNDLAAILALFILTLALACGLALLNRSIEFDRDEGFTLIKAWLFGRGASLYSQIWSDQPPMMTILLMLVIKVFGNSLLACRCFVGLCAAVLVTSFYGLVRQTVSVGAALIAALLLFYSPDFVSLSGSVMIGLPAMTFAVLGARFLADYGRNRQKRSFFFSLVSFSLSLQIKFIPVIYLPGLLVPLLMGPKDDLRPQGKDIKPALAWMTLLFLATSAAILYFAGSEWRQLVGPHVGVQAFGETRPELSRPITLKILRSFLPLAPLLLLSCLAWRRRRQPFWLIPFAWFACVMYFLLFHKPIRYHYGLNLAIPVAWMAVLALPQGLGIKAALRACARTGRSPWTQWAPPLAALVCIPLLVAARLPHMLAPALLAPPAWAEPIEPQVMRLLAANRSGSKDRLFTDRAIYAFMARMPMPPSLAVISGKRLNSGYLPGDFFMRRIISASPRHVILYRLPAERFSPAFPDFLAENYRLIYRSGLIRYYLKD